MAITKIIVENETTAKALCDLLCSQKVGMSPKGLCQAEIWINRKPVYLFDNITDPRPDAILRSLNEIETRRLTAIAWAQLSLPTEVFELLGLSSD
jgi:hypothetical protein